MLRLWRRKGNKQRGRKAYIRNLMDADLEMPPPPPPPPPEKDFMPVLLPTVTDLILPPPPLRSTSLSSARLLRERAKQLEPEGKRKQRSPKGPVGPIPALFGLLCMPLHSSNPISSRSFSPPPSLPLPALVVYTAISVLKSCRSVPYRVWTCRVFVPYFF